VGDGLLPRERVSQAEYHRAVADFVAEQVRLGQVLAGQITLAPHWRADYVGLVREYLASSSAAVLSAGPR
jgi:hypothetical protein